AGFGRRVGGTFELERRRGRRRRIGAFAAVAAAAAILSVATVRLIDAHDTPTPAAAPIATTTTPKPTAARPVAAPMPPDAEYAAGWAYVTDGRALAVKVRYAVPSGTYRIQVTSSDGAVTTVGTMSIVQGRGSWTGTTSTVLTGGSTIGLVDDTGNYVCHG